MGSTRQTGEGSVPAALMGARRPPKGTVNRESNPAGRRRTEPHKRPAIQGDLARELTQLIEAVREHGVTLPDASAGRLLTFATALLEWNDRLNLLSRPDAPNVVRKHVAASLGVCLVREPAPNEHWIDVGTGAGFPGLVLKIVRPHMNLTLLESARKRCIFLERITHDLSLAPTPILQMRAETLIERNRDHPGFDVVTARAVASLEDSLRHFGPLVAQQGSFITFKGPGWEADLEDLGARGVLVAAGFALETATPIPWTPGTLLHLRRISRSST